LQKVELRSTDSRRRLSHIVLIHVVMLSVVPLLDWLGATVDRQCG